jgi:glucosylceramidase
MNRFLFQHRLKTYVLATALLLLSNLAKTNPLQTSSINAFTTIEAESYTSMSGISTETCSDTGGGLNVGNTDTNDFIVFNNVNFGTGALSVDARIASAATFTGTAQFRLGSSTGTLIGTLSFGNTGGWQSWVTRRVTITSTTGIQNLYIVFQGGAAIGNLNWIKFNATANTNAFTTIEAESYSSMSGIQMETCSEGGLDVGWADANDFIVFNNIDFGTGATSVDARLASGASFTGTAQLRLGSTTGTLISTISFGSTGGWQTWATRNAVVTGATGVKNLYIVFQGGAGIGNLNWIKFNQSTAQVPAAPTNLVATPGNAQASLSWTASSGANSYTVRRSTTSGGSYSDVATGVTATSYTNTGLTNGTTYYYVVVALNAAGTSGNSNQASATPQTTVSIPAAPTSLAATAGNAQVALSWTASSGATSYTVRRSTTSVGSYSDVATGVTATSYTNTGLTNGTTYYYVVAAVNAAGTSANSNQASATPAATIVTINAFATIEAESFSSMSGIQTESCSEGGLDVGWTDSNDYIVFNNVDFGTGALSVDMRLASAATFTGTAEFRLGGITGTLIGTVSFGSTGDWQTWVTRNVSVTGATGVKNLYVVFQGGAGIGNVNWIRFNPSSAPTPPTNLTAIVGNTQLVLRWNASPIASAYAVKRSTTSGGPYTTLVSNLTTPGYTDAGLTNGTTYYYVVSASNAVGTSANSAQVSAAPSSSAVNYNVSVVWSSEKNPRDAAWYTAPMDFQYKLTAQPDLIVTQPGNATGTLFTVDPGVKYQTIYGMGSSLEETTVYNLRLMSQAKRTEALRLLVDPVNGAGMNLMRVCIGASDFTGRAWYTYDDKPAGQTDMSLSGFSIQKDIDYGIIQVIKEALVINPNIKIFASPWSPPAWMKTPETITGGTLKDGMYTVLAQYYVKFIQAYQTQGIPIYAMTLQNEPGHVTGDMPSMGLSYQQEIEIVKALKAELQKNNLTTKLWIHDHNFDNTLSYPANILADANAYAATDGTAFHDYGGTPSQMSDLHNLYPNKEIFFTERSVWGADGMDRIAQYFRNWACTYNSWVSMIDQNNDPNNGPFFADPTLLIKSTTSADGYWVIPELYLTGQYTKYVQAGAKRISSNYGTTGSLTNVAFLNPDGKIVMVMINNSSSEQAFTVSCQGNQFKASLPAKTVATYIWKSDLPLSGIPARQITSLIETDTDLSADVYPNPNDGHQMNLKVRGSHKQTTMITIINAQGVVVKQKTIEGGDGDHSLNNELKSGLYFIQIKNGEKQVTRRLIVN